MTVMISIAAAPLTTNGTVTDRDLYAASFAYEVGMRQGEYTGEAFHRLRTVATLTREAAHAQGMSDARISDVKYLAYGHAAQTLRHDPLRAHQVTEAVLVGIAL